MIDPVERFRAVAEEYCAIVDSPAELHLGNISKSLAELYLAVRDLPDIWATDDEFDPEIPTAQELALIDSLVTELGERDVYWSVDPYECEQPIAASRGADLGEIWVDLKRGLIALEKGRRDAAIYLWGWGFQNHWGQHLTDALRVIHGLRPA